MLQSLLATALLVVCAVASAVHRRITACSADAIDSPAVFGAQVTSLTAAVCNDFEALPGNDICLVNITITHPGTNDSVNTWVALPLNGWVGVLQGIGGGGFAAGSLSGLAAQSVLGYSAVTTDAGHSTNPADSNDATAWALISTGNVNQYNLLDFARRSLHDAAVIGKAVTQSYYGCPANYSYWNGCSTGGRQGLIMAQYYPDDYDGILADAPAVQWNDFTPAQEWPYIVMQNEGYAPPQCEYDAVVAAVIKACDALDGLVDGIISAPALCNFTAQSLVGESYVCDTNGSTGTFSQKLADVVEKIWQGPETPQGQFLWYGIVKGANFSTQAITVTNGSTTTAMPFEISDQWFKGFIAKDFDLDTSNLSYAQFAQFFLHGHIEYDSVIGSASQDLRAFRARGGKMITWQGLADYAINPQGTRLYYEKVLAVDPSAEDFYRLFYSPGVGHCGGGTGVTPTNAIDQLRAWVENSTAPATLSAGSQYPVNASSSYPVNGTNVRFLDLCPYPSVNKYTGNGDAALASSWECASNTGWEDFPGPTGGNYSACFGYPGWY